VLHLGDYIYEASQTPPKSQTPGADIGAHSNRATSASRWRITGRVFAVPPRSGHPGDAPDASLIATLDDHELADGAWRDGSIEHQADRDGPWQTGAPPRSAHVGSGCPRAAGSE